MLCIGSSIIETISIASIVPFSNALGGIAQPALISEILNYFDTDGVSSTDQIFILGSLSAALILISAILNLITIYVINRAAHQIGHKTSVALVNRYLKTKYELFFIETKANLQRKAIPEIDRIVNGIIIAILNVIHKTTAALLLFALILNVNLTLGLIIIAFGLSIYSLIYFGLKRRLNTLSRNVIESNEGRVGLLFEALLGIRELKINKLIDYYLQKFAGQSFKFNQSQSRYLFLSQAMKHLVEALGLLIILLYISIQLTFFDILVGDLMREVAIVALAAYKIMPALQNVYVNLVSIQYNVPALNQVEEDLDTYRAENIHYDTQLSVMEVEMTDVSYKYPGTSKQVINSLCMKLKGPGMVGVFGPSGSGKSTLIDLITGLIEPSSGSIKYLAKDDLELKGKPKFAYVSQQPFIFNSSLEANICLSTDPSAKDNDLFALSLQVAQINGPFIEKFSDGLKSLCGDAGIKLSGGDKQRIALARAVYMDADILILDESTSALDVATQTCVFKELKKLSEQKLVIMISHDLQLQALVDTSINLPS